MAARPSVITRITKRRGVRQFVKFAIVGGSGAVVSLIVFTVLQRAFLAEEQQYSNGFFVAGFMAGGVSNYFLNRAWTFRSTGHAGREAAQFLGVSAVALVVGLVAKTVLYPWVGYGHISWLVGTAAGVVVNFFANKYWTFRSVL